MNLSIKASLIAALVLLALIPGGASAVLISGTWEDTDLGLAAVAFDLKGVAGTGAHDVTAPPLGWAGTKWGVLAANKKFEEKEGAGNDKDELRVNVTFQHKVRPPNDTNATHDADPVNGKKLEFDFTVKAGEGLLRDQGANSVPKFRVVEHGRHRDRVNLVLTVFVDQDMKEIVAYHVLVSGRHFVPPPPPEKKHGKCGLEDKEPSAVFGSCLWALDPDTGELDLSIAASGISPTQLKQANIRTGSPSKPGTTALSLPTVSFTDFDSLGISAAIIGVVPPEFIDYLENDNTFLELIAQGSILQGQLTGFSVGGVAELPDVADTAPLQASGSSALSSGLLAIIGAVTAGILALSGGAWYARRRVLSR